MPFPAATTASSGMCITPGPLDVCTTPGVILGGPGPLPYPNIGMTSDGSGSSKVKIQGKNTLRKDDKLSMSSGDDAGNSPGGVVSGKFKGSVVFKDGCGAVKAEGKCVAYHTVPCEHNDGNTMGMHTVPCQTSVTVIGPPGPAAGAGAGTQLGGAGSGGGEGEPVTQRIPGASSGDPVKDARSVLDCSEKFKEQIAEFRTKGGTIKYGSDPGEALNGI